MPVPNPEYDPNWEERHDIHKEEFDRLMAIDFDIRPEGTQEQIEHHLHELQSCLSCYQHKTIQDMAAWVFQNFDPGESMLSEGRMVNQFDFEKFKTREEVTAAWVEARELVDMLENEKMRGMETGRPKGLDIFEEIGSNTVQIEWQDFTHQELLGDKWDFADRSVRAMVSLDLRENEFHICFSEAHKRIGASATNMIEDLATVMYQRISEKSSEQGAQKPKNKWVDLGVRFVEAVIGAGTNTIKPENFHFYLHQGPYQVGHENFGPVKMEFRNGKFCNPQFLDYDVMPESIQKAHRESFSFMKNVSAAPMKTISNQSDDHDRAILD